MFVLIIGCFASIMQTANAGNQSDQGNNNQGNTKTSDNGNKNNNKENSNSGDDNKQRNDNNQENTKPTKPPAEVPEVTYCVEGKTTKTSYYYGEYITSDDLLCLEVNVWVNGDYVGMKYYTVPINQLKPDWLFIMCQYYEYGSFILVLDGAAIYNVGALFFSTFLGSVSDIPLWATTLDAALTEQSPPPTDPKKATIAQIEVTHCIVTPRYFNPDSTQCNLDMFFQIIIETDEGLTELDPHRLFADAYFAEATSTFSAIWFGDVVSIFESDWLVLSTLHLPEYGAFSIYIEVDIEGNILDQKITIA